MQVCGVKFKSWAEGSITPAINSDTARKPEQTRVGRMRKNP